MKKNNFLKVMYGKRKVGTLAMADDIKLDRKKSIKILEEIQDIVYCDLEEYL